MEDSTIFRSEQMQLSQLYLQPDTAYAAIAELGELGVVQFRDLNPNVNAFQRKFVNEVRRCEEMERKLRFLEGEMKKDEIPIEAIQGSVEAPSPRQMIDLEATLDQLDHQLKEINTNADALLRNFNELTELKHNLAMTQAFFQDSPMLSVDVREESVDVELTGNANAMSTKGMQLGYVTGVILRDRMNAFERMLWRVCRGNVFLKSAEIPETIQDPATGDLVAKVVFVVFFQGEQLKTRVQKICEGFRANVYPCPETFADRRELAVGVMTRLEDLNHILHQTRDHRQRVLFSTSRNVRQWQIQVLKSKSIYHTMNMFNHDLAKKSFIAECWTPVNRLEEVRLAMNKGATGEEMPSIIHRLITLEQPPTFHRLNKFTQGFQNLVDAYGVATYREVNPMPFVLITFPFLFAVMFGDAGHGILLSLFAFWMIFKEKTLQFKWRTQEVWTIFFGGRYIIFLMGLFSIYTGLIYNDVFSKPINIFGSSWRANFDDSALAKYESVTLEPTPFKYNGSVNYQQMFSGNPYPLGLDPVWQLADNKITFTNSVKMKAAIILGVTQMAFGVFLSLWNHIHFRHYSAVFLEFLPQLIFLSSIFFYLIIMIFYKWTHFQGSDATNAPSLLIHLINMMLLSYPTDAGTPPSSLLFYSNQKSLQTILLLVAVICIPWLLLGKPLYEIYRRKKRAQESSSLESAGTSSHPPDQRNVLLEMNDRNVSKDKEEKIDDDHHHHLEIEMSEIWVEQGIHTIEYFLGCISHTASYLRLWALSLAHAQLSEVLWHMVLQNGLSMNGPLGGIALFIVFMPWSTLTVFILLLMEGLSAFLHALRLHWVEFQSKFYKGEGYPFVPFSFRLIEEENPLEI